MTDNSVPTPNKGKPLANYQQDLTFTTLLPRDITTNKSVYVMAFVKNSLGGKSNVTIQINVTANPNLLDFDIIKYIDSITDVPTRMKEIMLFSIGLSKYR